MRRMVCFAAMAVAGCASSLGDIPGRWELHSSFSRPGSCVLTFSGTPSVAHGTVAAEGFCPQIFSALPQWRIAASHVVISNRHGDMLAEFAVGYSHLDGRTVTGEALSLDR